MFPSDPVISQFRNQIAASGPLTVAADDTAMEEATAGNIDLSNGNAAGAISRYEKAQKLGWNPVFAKFNLAMAAVLEGDAAKALGDVVPTVVEM